MYEIQDKTFRILVCLTLVWGATTGTFANTQKYTLPLNPYSYHEQFETTDPFVFWATNNAGYTVNFKGLSTERFFEGEKSFKLDITVPAGTYVLYRIPLKVPADQGQSLLLQARVFVESVSDGYFQISSEGWLEPPNISLTNGWSASYSPTASWMRVYRDIAPTGLSNAQGKIDTQFGGSRLEDYGIYSNAIAINVYSPNGGRFVVFVDDVSLTGTAPDTNQYATSMTGAWQNYLTRVKDEVASLAGKISDASTDNLEPDAVQALTQAQATAQTILSATNTRGYPTPSEYSELNRLVSLLDLLPQPSSASLRLYPWNPMTAVKLLPSDYPVPAQESAPISITASPGETTSAGLVVRAQKSLTAINISVSNLVNGIGSVISRDAVEVFLAETWYQAGLTNVMPTGKYLVPELLVKDHAFLQIDQATKTNYLRVYSAGQPQYVNISDVGAKIPAGVQIRDAETFQPFPLAADTNKQIWVRVRVPNNASAGHYVGSITVDDGEGHDYSLNVDLTVNPFSLPRPLLDYGIYYRGYLKSTPDDNFNSDNKSPAQYTAEMIDLVDHGIMYPTLTQEIVDPLLGQSLSIRQSAGMPTESLYIMNTGAHQLLDGMPLNQFNQGVQRWPTETAKFGVFNYYFYGRDELYGEPITQEKAAFDAVHSLGHKNFASLNVGTFQYASEQVDTALLYCEGWQRRDFHKEEVAQWHGAGKKVFIYSAPQVGVENPELYRRNYGLALWCADYDGAMDYAYQHAFGDIWNDFDHATYRDHVFAYPATDSVIDTVEWEGFREAVNDVRYVSALSARVGEKIDDEKAWICPRVEGGEDLDTVRSAIIDRINAVGDGSGSSQPEVVWGDVFAFPNPASQTVKLHVEAKGAEGIRVEYFNEGGSLEKRVETTRIKGTQGEMSVFESVWEVGHAPSGVYVYVVYGLVDGQPIGRYKGKVAVVK